MDGPLTGIRIIDSTSVMAMPTAMYIMADMGAEVIKVENPTANRSAGMSLYPDNEPGEEPWNRDGGFHALHRSKLGITLNYKVPEALEVLHDLVRVSDVLAENNRPGVMDRLGLGYEDLKKINPKLIYFSFSGFGQTGPWKDYQGIGRMFELTAGVSQFTGYPDEGPRRVGSAWFDPPNGWMVVFAILSALHHRERTGQGQRVDHAMYQLGVSTVGDAILDFIANSRSGKLMGNKHPFMAPHGTYPCRGDDCWIAIAVDTDEQWRSLCQIMGNPDWVAEEKFADGLSRWKNQEELDVRLSEWTAAQDKSDLANRLRRSGVPAGAVLNTKEVMTDPHMRERGFFERITYPPERGIGTRMYVGRPWKMSETPSYIRRPAPRLGEHNELVLRDILGRGEDEITRLYELGALAKEPQGSPVPTPRLDLGEEVEAGGFAGYDTDYKEILGTA